MKNTTTGTVTAEVKDGLKYVSNEFYRFYKDPRTNQWNAQSADRKDEKNAIQLSFRFPPNGNETFQINNSNDATSASASWTVHSVSGIRPFIATSGELTNVNLDIPNGTASFNFFFTAESGGQKVIVSEGSCEYQNFDDTLSIAKADTAGTFTATLEGGAYTEYNANRFQLEALPADPVVGPNTPHWRAWSQTYSFDVPNHPLDSVNILCACDLGPGTYELAAFKDKIRVSYSEYRPGIIVGYSVRSGKLVIEQVPVEGSSQGFTGRLDFISEIASNGTQITFNNGRFTFINNPQTP
jgi:hypothetical protein